MEIMCFLFLRFIFGQKSSYFQAIFHIKSKDKKMAFFKGYDNFRKTHL
jgi:hypothetical protein